MSTKRSRGPRRPPLPGILGQAHRIGAAGYRRVLAWQLLRTLLRLGFLGTAASLVGHLIMDSAVDMLRLAIMLAALVLAVLAGVVADREQAGAEASVAAGLRSLAGRRLASMPARLVQSLPQGIVIVSMQRHPGALAALVIGHRVAATMMAAGPLLVAAAMVLVSWRAALAVLLLTPVMIVFFVLLGTTIRSRAEAQEKAFGVLAGQFADRIRALPTILANHALADEESKLAFRLHLHAGKTMGVLRVAFLNVGVIDFFSSLSIAILAVLLGLGHLGLATMPGFDNLQLWQSLFVLMLASEYFAPFRRFAEQYHAKAEGLAAATALDALLDTPSPPEPNLPQVERGLAQRLPETGLVVLRGPSGSGKSTMLRRLAGLTAGEASAPLPDTGATWIATDSFVASGSLGQAIAGADAGIAPARILLAASQVGLLDDELLPGGLEAPIVQGGANLSGGQRIRIGTARALLRDGTVFADEPTAKLDRATAAMVRQALVGIATKRLVVTATHDVELARMAAMTIELDNAGLVEQEERP